MRHFVPAAEFLPDQGELRNSGLLTCKNLVPYGAAGKLLPVSGVKEVSDAQPTANPFRGHAVQANIGAIYAGDTVDIFEVDTLTDPWPWTKVTRGAGTYTVGAEGWSMTSFFDHMVAAPGYGDDLQIRLDGAGLFLDCITNAEPLNGAGGVATGNWPPKPKFAAHWGTRLAIANLQDPGPMITSFTSNPNTSAVWVSQTDNARTFSTPHSLPGGRSGYFNLSDKHGDITALAGGSEFGVVGKQTSVYRVQYGGPFGVEFYPIGQNIGIRYHNSLVWVGNDLYGMFSFGPGVIRGGQIFNLGFGRVARSLRDDTWIGLDPAMRIFDLAGASSRQIYGAFDALTQNVYWAYRGSALTYSTRILAYNILTGRFSIIDAGVLRRYAAETTTPNQIQGILTLPDSDREFSALRDVVMLGSSFGGANPVYWQFVDDGDEAAFDSDTSVGTGFMELGNELSRVRKVRPVYSTPSGASAPVINVKVEWKNDPAKAASSTTSTETAQRGGWITIPESEYAALQRVTLIFKGDAQATHPSKTVAEIEGFEIDVELGGDQ